jgi:hypothetical protein
MAFVFAAAGLAEAAWAEFCCMVLLSMALVFVIALFALALRSRILAMTAAAILMFVTVFFQLPYLFTPFEPAAYADPDVQSAAGMFRNVGVLWVVTCIAVAGILAVTWLFPRKKVAAVMPGEGNT